MLGWAKRPRGSLRFRLTLQRTNSKSAVVSLPEHGKATREPWRKFMSSMALGSRRRPKSRKSNQRGLPSRPLRGGNRFERPEREVRFLDRRVGGLRNRRPVAVSG